MKRCPRCQSIYSDEVRWCPADGTPTEEPTSGAISPALLAAAAADIADLPIPDGPVTLRDMPAVGAWESESGPDTLLGATPSVVREPAPPASLGGAADPLSSRTSSGILRALPDPRGPALPPDLLEIAASISSPTSIAPTDTMVGSPAPRPPGPLANTLTGTTADPPRAPAGATLPAISPTPPIDGLTGTTADPPRAPAHLAAIAAVPNRAHLPGPVSMGWDIPEPPPDPSPTGPVSPHAHVPGPVSMGWDVPELPSDLSPSGPALSAMPEVAQPAPLLPSSTLPGFAPSPEIVRLIQEQRAKTAAMRAPQPLAEPMVAPEVYTSVPPLDELDTDVGVPSITPPSIATPSPTSPSDATTPAEPPAPSPPSASMLEAPAYPHQPQPPRIVAERSASQTDNAMRTARSKRTLWIVFAVIALAIIGALIAMLATR